MASGVFSLLQCPRKGVLKMNKGKLLVAAGRGKLLLDIGDIIYIEVINHHTIIHCRRGDYTVRCPIREFEELLEGKGFCRIHRSFLIAVDYVNVWEKDRVILSDRKASELPVGGCYREAFADMMEGIAVLSL